MRPHRLQAGIGQYGAGGRREESGCSAKQRSMSRHKPIDDELDPVNARWRRDDVRHVARVMSVRIEEAVLSVIRIEMRSGARESRSGARTHRMEMHTMLADATGQPIDRVAKDVDRDYIMEPEQAVNYGMIDRVISSRDLAPVALKG